MRKELVWAGIIGISFGLIIGFGAWRIRSSMSPKGKPVPTATPNSSVGQSKITLDKPENFDVITASPMTVSGITKSLTWVIVSTEKSDYLTQSKEDGSFSVDVDLTPGINNIVATSINAQGGTSSQKIVSVYSASFQANTSSAPDTTSGADDLDRAVAAKVAQAEKPPKAYIGTVTDIIDSTIQIKSIDSQIQQLATNDPGITVINTKGTANKAVKLTDVAIGDFIVAMGYINGNDVLNTQRILVANAPSESQISVAMQNVESVSKKDLTLAPVGGGETSIVTPDKNTDIEIFTEGKTKDIKLTDISESDRVITVSDTAGTPAIRRSIFTFENEDQ